MKKTKYLYLNKACDYITEITSRNYDEDDLLKFAIDNKIAIAVSASNWSVKKMDGKVFRFDGYFNLDNFTIKDAYQTFERGRPYSVAQFPVKNSELFSDLNFPITPNDIEFTVLNCDKPNSCLVRKPDLVVNIDYLDDLIRDQKLPCHSTTAHTLRDDLAIKDQLTQEVELNSPGSSIENAFKKNSSGTWEFTFKSKVYPAIKEYKGFHYILHLLKNPNKDISCEVLNSIVNGKIETQAVDTVSLLTSEGLSINKKQIHQDVLDPKAINAYKDRLELIQHEIENASELGDIEKKEEWKEEQDILLAEIKKSTKGFNKVKSFKTQDRKITQSVTSNIKNSLGTLAERCPELYQHLYDEINTGSVCTYRNSSNINWSF